MTIFYDVLKSCSLQATENTEPSRRVYMYESVSVETVKALKLRRPLDMCQVHMRMGTQTCAHVCVLEASPRDLKHASEYSEY